MTSASTPRELSRPVSRRTALMAVIATPIGLAACGGGKGGSGGQSSVRALNLTNDLPSIDLYIGGNKQFSALTSNTLSANVSVDAASYAINVNSAGNASTLATGTYSLSKDAHYTAVVWGTQSNLRVSTLPEDEDGSGIGAGNTRVRMFNATTETGAVDVYFTAPAADLGAATPNQASLPSGQLAGFREIPAGTYRLRVTGVGKPDDVRLDVDAVTLAAGKFATLVITGGLGGVLVNGTLVQQQGTVASLPNATARVRVIASVDNGGVVAVTTGSTVVSGGLVSRDSNYVLVPAGVLTNTVRVNGNIVSSGPQTFVAGNDYTMLVYGPPSAPRVSLISDDNKLPLSTTRTKIRVINAVASLDALSLSVDNGGVAASSFVSAGTASAYSQVASNASAQIEVNSPTLGPVYLTSRSLGDALLGQGVYTVLVYSSTRNSNGIASKLINERP